MDDKQGFALILLTYKGKALMMYEYESAIDNIQHDWTFIGSRKLSGESMETSLSKKIKNEAGIKISDIKLLSGNFYHATLSDEHVNSITRREEQLLDFFTLKELQKLPLSEQSKKLVEEYGNLI